MIRLLVMDIDGVLTDGCAMIGQDGVRKSICFKDLDAIALLKKKGIKIGVLTGEKDFFTEYVEKTIRPDFFVDGCKEKKAALEKYAKENEISMSDVCYIGDGKYDIEPICIAGLGVCPNDAVKEVKKISDMVLSRNGGAGCISELYSWMEDQEEKGHYGGRILECLQQHREVNENIIKDMKIKAAIDRAVKRIVYALTKGGQLLLCGNGGSAADAQHLATELVSRFYKEREAINAEALTVNTSTLTAVANDYDYSSVFERQVEAKGKKGDVLIGITTSGSSDNILRAFQRARQKGMETIAFIGDKREAVEGLADIIISVPSSDTPRIQEMHIMIGHIICELVEQALYEQEKVGEHTTCWGSCREG